MAPYQVSPAREKGIRELCSALVSSDGRRCLLPVLMTAVPHPLHRLAAFSRHPTKMASPAWFCVLVVRTTGLIGCTGRRGSCSGVRNAG